MSLEQTTDLYASVLRQLLPEGVYDTAEMTHVADDIYAHAKALAQADIDAHRLLQVLETIPVDLLADYEREYGLPMQCMVPGSQTIEERINVLRWIRQHRNVMNREYLEQILAIFGVTLVDVVKHYPMQCTAPCTAPVNTERLRYKVLLRLQYPMTADMSCIIENYLPGYLRVEWIVDMPWGEWIINPTVTVNTAGIAHYKAYKTNQRQYYDSFADFDLVTALVRSFHDSDIRQNQAVTVALASITKGNVYQWFNDIDVIKYKETTSITENTIVNAKWKGTFDSFEKAVLADYTPVSVSSDGWSYTGLIFDYKPAEPYNGTNIVRYAKYTGRKNAYGYAIGDYVVRVEVKTLSVTQKEYEIAYSDIAKKIIANTSSLNPSEALAANNFLKAIANSIFDQYETKQFVKLSDLLSQLERNKTLRT